MAKKTAKKPAKRPKTMVLATLDEPAPAGMLVYVKGDKVIARERTNRGKSKRIGCKLRSKAGR